MSVSHTPADATGVGNQDLEWLSKVNSLNISNKGIALFLSAII